MNEDKVFVDTNIFVYAKLDSSQDANKRREAVAILSAITGEILVSTQVLGEFSVALLRHNVPEGTILRAVQAIAAECTVVPILLGTVEKALSLREKYRFSFWDSLILSSALESGCRVVLSEDLQHEQIIEGSLKVVNPFRNTSQ
jgi:predicted nucleic acid-binding protein